MTWYCITHGFQRGPMTLDAMRALVAKGALAADDWVWEPGLGADWRRAGNVPGLFPAAAAEEPGQPLGQPLPPAAEGGAPSVRAALSHALGRMFQMLFKPFAAGVWMKFCLFIMMARMNPLSELAARVLQTVREPGDPAPEYGPQLALGLAQRLAAKWDAFAAAPFSGRLSDAVLAFLVLALTLVLALHVGGWGVFLLLHGWRNPRARLLESFSGIRGSTGAFIRWKFAYTLPLAAVFLAGAFVFFKEAVLPFSRGVLVDAAEPRVWGSFLVWGGALALLSFVNFLTDQFAAPLMGLSGGSVRGAFALVWRCAAQHPWPFARLVLAYGVFMSLAAFFPLAAMAQAQTGNAGALGLVLLCAGFVPFHVLMRGLALCYLEQWRPGLVKGLPRVTN